MASSLIYVDHVEFAKHFWLYVVALFVLRNWTDMVLSKHPNVFSHEQAAGGSREAASLLSPESHGTRLR